MDTKFEYCVAIRTLGMAGEKYLTLLNSLRDQTIEPKRILVYIPHGYPAPKETIGIEEIIRCEKGMVTQRSLPFEEIDTEYVLFCDDDLYLPPSFVERMYTGLKQYNGDCISPEVYYSYKAPFFKKLAFFIHSFVSPRSDDGWAIKIKRNASSSYNNHPIAEVLPTESAAFACLLCKMSAHRAIHFEDERWIEHFSFAAGDDTLYYYKLFLSNFKVLKLFNSGLKHLDAQTGIRPDIRKKMYYHKMILFIMWYRIVFEPRLNRENIRIKTGRFERLRCISAFGWRCIFGVLTLPMEVIHYRQLGYFIDYFRGLYDGWLFVHSDEYKFIPSFDSFIKNRH